MLSSALFPPSAKVRVLDIGAGYGVVTEEDLAAFSAARVTVENSSQACSTKPSNASPAIRTGFPTPL
jgi:hypothetical protein